MSYKRLVTSMAAVLAMMGLTAVTPNVARAERPAEERQQRVVRCQGVKATIVGNSRNNRLYGTQRRDVIAGMGGSDVIAGLGRRDLLCGGSGHDVVDGGPGRDRLYGQTGRDYCAGERREHRFHYSCEIHAPRIRMPRPRGVPRRTFAQSATPVSAIQALRGWQGDSWFRYTDPWCESGQINLGNFLIRGEYTEPAYVYVVTGVAYWNDRTGGWESGRDNEAIIHGYWTIPNDGQFYQVNAQTWQRRLFGTSYHAHAVWWWNGTEWVDGTVYPINGYFNAVSFLNVCIT